MQFYSNFHFCDQLLEHCSNNSNARGLSFGIHLWLIQKPLHIFNLIWLVETQNWFVGIVGQLFGNCILFCHKILKWEKLPRIFTISKWAHQNKLTFLWRNWVHIFPVQRIKCLIGFDFHVESFSSFPSMQTYHYKNKLSLQVLKRNRIVTRYTLTAYCDDLKPAITNMCESIIDRTNGQEPQSNLTLVCDSEIYSPEIYIIKKGRNWQYQNNFFLLFPYSPWKTTKNHTKTSRSIKLPRNKTKRPTKIT